MKSVSAEPKLHEEDPVRVPEAAGAGAAPGEGAVCEAAAGGGGVRRPHRHGSGRGGFLVRRGRYRGT